MVVGITGEGENWPRALQVARNKYKLNTVNSPPLSFMDNLEPLVSRFTPDVDLTSPPQTEIARLLCVWMGKIRADILLLPHSPPTLAWRSFRWREKRLNKFEGRWAGKRWGRGLQFVFI